MVIVAESPKLVPRLGTTKALPVEVVRFAWPTTRARVLDLVPSATLRPTPDGSPFVTDEGHHLLDCTLPATDLPTLATALKSTLGVVEHGLFTDQADEVLRRQPRRHRPGPPPLTRIDDPPRTPEVKTCRFRHGGAVCLFTRPRPSTTIHHHAAAATSAQPP